MPLFCNLESETMCRDILEHVADALIYADNQGFIRAWNLGAESVFGFTASEACGQSLDIIIPDSLREAHWNGYHRAIAHGATEHGARSRITRALHNSGKTLYVDMSFSVVRNQAGETIGSLAIARDATQRHSEEKQLRRQLAELAAKHAKGPNKI